MHSTAQHSTAQHGTHTQTPLHIDQQKVLYKTKHANTRQRYVKRHVKRYTSTEAHKHRGTQAQDRGTQTLDRGT